LKRRKTYAGTELIGTVSSLLNPRGTWRGGIDKVIELKTNSVTNNFKFLLKAVQEFTLIYIFFDFVIKLTVSVISLYDIEQRIKLFIIEIEIF
jgi:hypothetical protein